MSIFTEYVAGFLFDGPLVAVVLKNKPLWQAGRFNAIGGKLEPGETPAEAMRREFKEETKLTVKDWREFCQLHCTHEGEKSFVHFFAAHADRAMELPALNDVGESLHYVGHSSLNWHNAIPNLPWLIIMALSGTCVAMPYYTIKES